jgi:uncharacterized iron-regulated membrane protein
MHATPSSGLAANAANMRYRTLWRWHFYAGLFVMPFLIVLAITGTLYCFQPQIEPLLYPHRLIVEPASTPRLEEDRLLQSAIAFMPAGARVATASINSDPRRSAEFVFRLPGGEKESVYLNPYTGVVLGTLSVDKRFMQVDRMLHRKLLLGKPGELLMELAACWTLVMVGTGVALWWPRPSSEDGGSFWPRFGLKGRAFWKSVHAVMGFWLALGAVAFILTGLPWSGSWGKHFKALAATVHLGSPPGIWGEATLHSRLPATATQGVGSHPPAGGGQQRMEAMPGMVMDDLPLERTPWAVGNTAVPQSHDAVGIPPLAPSHIAAIARERGLASGYDIAFPSSATGVYTVSYFPPDPKMERTLHIDQYSGKVLEDIGYGNYGGIAQAISYGTSLHMGRYFGFVNQLVCAAISMGLALIAVTGCIMWWQRRPRYSLGAPTPLPGPVRMRGWKAGMVLLGMIFPLMGASMLTVWTLDWLAFGRQVPRSQPT